MKRPMLLGSIIFITGAFLGTTISSFYLVFIPFVSILAIVLKLAVDKKNNYLLFLYGLIFIIIFNIGFFRGFVVRKEGFGELYSFYDKKVALCGEVVNINIDKKYFDVEGKWIATENYKKNINVKVRVSTFLEPEINIKDYIVVEGNLHKYNKIRFLGDTDLQKSFASQRIFASLFAENIEIAGNYADEFDLIKLGANVRSALSDKIDNLIGGQEGALLKGILTGDKEDLSDETMEDLSLSGLSHIAAVSGINISIFISALSIFIFLGSRKKHLTSILTIIAVFVYVVIVGNEPSVYRAAAMLVYSVVINELRLRNDNLNSLMFSTLILTFINPYLIFNISFQLSFFATLGLVLYSNFFKTSIFGVTLSVFLVITPVIAYYFNIITLAAFFTNVLISLLVSIALPLGYIMYFLPFLSGFLKFLMYLILIIAKAFADFPLFIIKVPSPDLLFISLYVILLYIIFALLKKLPKIRIYYALIALTIVSIYGCIIKYPCTEINFVSVGNGNAIFIKTQDGKRMLIDTGEPKRDNNSAIFKYLTKRGIRKLDFVLITCYKPEHIGGLPDVIRNLNVKKVYLPQRDSGSDFMNGISKTLEKIETVYYNQGSIKNDNVNIDILDNSSYRDKTNDKIVTLKIRCYDNDFLIMGDGDASYELSLIDKLKTSTLKSDVLLMSDHGSEYATDNLFLKTVNPKCLVSSNDKKITFDVNTAAPLLETNVVGTIKFKINQKDKLTIKSLRNGEEDF